jgi:hypothetical protein
MFFGSFGSAAGLYELGHPLATFSYPWSFDTKTPEPSDIAVYHT